MEQAFQFCASRVRDADKDRFLATLFAPALHRGPLFALYAFDAEISQVRERITSPLPGEVRLQWWRDVLTGTEPGDTAANPIALALGDVVRRFVLPVRDLLDLIDAHTFDLYDDPMPTLAALETYAVATCGTMVNLAARILNDGLEPDCEDAFGHTGIAAGTAKALRELGLHSPRGQQYVPDDVLTKHGLQAADLRAGQATSELRAALADVRQVAEHHLVALKSSGNGVPRPLLPAFLPLALVPQALATMSNLSADPFHPPLPPQWRRQWTLWRAARNPARFIKVR